MPGLLQKGKKYFFKVIDEFEFNFVFENCPVQVLKGRTVNDIETNRLYLSLTCLNVGEKPITGLGLRIFFYGNQSRNKTLPDRKEEYFIDLTQAPPPAFVADKKPEKHSKKAEKDKLFGYNYFVELTDSYFTRLDIGITKVVFADGTHENYSAVSRSEYSSFGVLNKEERSAYNDINIYQSAEERHPAKVIPTKDEFTWVCCCGAKNSIQSEKCAVCERDRDWQFANLTVANLDKVADDYSHSAQAMRHKASEARAKVLSSNNLTKEQIAEKERRDTEAIERSERVHMEAEKRKKRALSIALLWLVAIALYIVFSSIFGGGR